jgi:hypothetical protein
MRTAEHDVVRISEAHEHADLHEHAVGPGHAARIEVAGDMTAAQSLLDERDALMSSSQTKVVSRIKRAVADFENELLDTVRRDRRNLAAAELVGDTVERSEQMAGLLLPPLLEVVEAGAEFVETDATVLVDHDEVSMVLAALVAEWLVNPLCDRLTRVLEQTDDRSPDRGESVDALRAVFRDWRSERLVPIGGDFATHAFNRGVLAAMGTNDSLCWVVDHGGLPCPDAEDNRLAGAVTAGTEFPTGDICPPAHPGCRCLLVPADR